VRRVKALVSCRKEVKFGFAFSLLVIPSLDERDELSFRTTMSIGVAIVAILTDLFEGNKLAKVLLVEIEVDLLLA
jgi:hypothetical protein